MGPSTNALSLAELVGTSSDHLKTLPSVHSTSAFRARSIFDKGAVETSLCKTFRKQYIYLFYGRSEYRPDPDTGAVRDGQFKPVAFVFHTEAIAHQVTRLFPTDSGGFARRGGPKEAYFYKDVQIEDLELKPYVSEARRTVRRFYRTNKRYLEYHPLEGVQLPQWAFEARSYHRMIRDSTGKGFDDRSSTIELIFSDSILLDHARFVVVPSEYHNTPLIKEAKSQHGFRVGYYRSNPKQTPDQTFEAIRAKVETYVRNHVT